ncbi:competence type IV pilus minor pilin ComGF [Salipaludibacillus aurantiacus]|uniref:Competence protein ComGF n=1 Tax=Salipaludibacillus aurantiacus TaxID=1601833 RepID=A0A1H9PP16_9BACI|nr:competence type IV pilus minor pilin ComGF [Salipaludibacillus aurantiacus]SER49897.1 competence protein ComGF [Salipaludibacillus aurantiacus]
MLKHTVSRYICRNEQGVTLLELMIGIVIFLYMTSVFSFMFHYWTVAGGKYNDFSYEELLLFVNHLQMEFNGTELYWTDKQKLYLLKPEDQSIVHYEHYNDKVRRQVGGRGHEVFLQRVETFQVYEKPYGIDIVVSSNKQTWEKSLIHPSFSIGRNGGTEEERQ